MMLALSLFALMPYLWLVFMLAIIVAAISGAVMSRPKRPPAPQLPTDMQASDPLSGEAEPSLDFEDELSQMNK